MKADAGLARAVAGLFAVVYAGVERVDLGALAEVVVVRQGPLQGLAFGPVVGSASVAYVGVELVGSSGIHGGNARGAVAAACGVNGIEDGIPVAAVLVVGPKHPGAYGVVGAQCGLARWFPLGMAQAK